MKWISIKHEHALGQTCPVSPSTAGRNAKAVLDQTKDLYRLVVHPCRGQPESYLPAISKQVPLVPLSLEMIQNHIVHEFVLISLGLEDVFKVQAGSPHTFCDTKFQSSDVRCEEISMCIFQLPLGSYSQILILLEQEEIFYWSYLPSASLPSSHHPSITPFIPPLHYTQLGLMLSN